MKLSILIAIFILFVTGCRENMVSVVPNNTIYGEWFSKGDKKINDNNYLKILYKEEFLKNGDLYSTKWFNIKDKNGRDLGEFYITKLFKWRVKGNQIVAKFIRCQTGITKPLKISNIGYLKLKKSCDMSLYKNGKIAVKNYKLINRKLILGNRVYSRVLPKSY